VTDPLSPPPWRTIPADVQARILESAEEEPRRRKALVPLAAGFVALAIAAVFAIQAIGGSEQAATTSPALDRCAAAMPDAPARSEWEQAFEAPFGDFTVIALRVAGKPVFCEITHTAVTVSTAEPAYLPGSSTGLVMTTSLGTIAGVADPSWRDLQIKTGQLIRPPTIVDGLFITGFRNSRQIEVTSGGNPWTAMPAPAEAPVTVVDARQGPAPDRTSGRGKLLGDCIDAALRMGGVVDPDSWEPGAMAESQNGRMIVTRNAYGYSSCWLSVEMGDYASFGMVGGTAFYQADKSANQGPAPTVFPEYSEMDGDMVVFGVVPPDSSRVQLTITGSAPIEADVANSTFAALVPQSATAGPPSPKITYRIYNSTGQLTYDGPPLR
jgi:hypothetical protein